MSSSTTSLVAILSRRRDRAREAEERLHRLRGVLHTAIRDLSVGKDERIVRAELESRGVKV